MAYYDRIAKQWQEVTGAKGGAFKEFILNDLLIDKLPGISDAAILELGIGNGYFMPLVMRRFSGQQYARLVLTDQSGQLLKLAEKLFRIPYAEYQLLDIGTGFPFENDGFDLIIATYLFNEVSIGSLKKAINECYRVLEPGGLLLMTVAHPDFVSNLNNRGQIKRTAGGILTMPGARNLRVPVALRSANTYEQILTQAGFQFEGEDVYPDDKVLNAKPGLRKAGRVPLALLYSCQKINLATIHKSQIGD